MKNIKLIIINLLLISFIFPAELYNNSWALIIGINEYEKVTKLNFAVEDAQAISDLMIEQFNFPAENITILLDENLKVIKSFDGMDWLPGDAKKDIENIIKIYN